MRVCSGSRAGSWPRTDARRPHGVVHCSRPLAGGDGAHSSTGGFLMHALRSRTGVVSITVSAAVLLALPVVASGQVPGVDKVVGGVTDTAQSVAPVSVPPALPAPPS